MTSLRQYLQSNIAMRIAASMRGAGEYICMEDFVLDRGQEYPVQTLTPAELEEVREAMAATGWDFEVKQCFANSQMLVIHDDRFTYVEGYAIGRAPIACLHAWVLFNGKVVDVTWRDYDDIGEPPPLQPHPEHQYIGLEFDRKLIHERAVASGEVSTLIDDWPNNYPLLQQPRLNPILDEVQALADQMKSLRRSMA